MNTLIQCLIFLPTQRCERVLCAWVLSLFLFSKFQTGLGFDKTRRWRSGTQSNAGSIETAHKHFAFIHLSAPNLALTTGD